MCIVVLEWVSERSLKRSSKVLDSKVRKVTEDGVLLTQDKFIKILQQKTMSGTSSSPL